MDESNWARVMGGALATYLHAREWALWTWRKVKRGLALLGAVAVAVMGAVVGYGAAMTVRQSDSVLLQLAQETNAVPLSAQHERDLFLFMFMVGVVLTIWGLKLAREWFGPTGNEESI
jgi:hypothetical protein